MPAQISILDSPAYLSLKANRPCDLPNNPCSGGSGSRAGALLREHRTGDVIIIIVKDSKANLS